jgi:hypothetical protein
VARRRYFPHSVFGYRAEPEDLRQRRIRQANLMGPVGFVSVDDSEVIEFAQNGLRQYPEGNSVMKMGGRDWQESESHIVTEGAIRSFYDYYRRVRRPQVQSEAGHL